MCRSARAARGTPRAGHAWYRIKIARASPFNALHPPSWGMAAPARARPGDAPGVQQRLEARTAFGAARGHATRRRQGPAGQAEQALGLRHVVSGRKVFDDAHLPGRFQCAREFGSGEAARAGELVAAQRASIPQAGHQRKYTIPGWSFHGGYVGRTCPAAQSFAGHAASSYPFFRSPSALPIAYHSCSQLARESGDDRRRGCRVQAAAA